MRVKFATLIRTSIRAKPRVGLGFARPGDCLIVLVLVVLGLLVVNQSTTKDDDGEHPGMPDRPRARSRPRLLVVHQSRTKHDDEDDDGEHPGMPDRPRARRRPRAAGRAPFEDDDDDGEHPGDA